MKRLFRIVVVICPLINLALMLLLAAKNPAIETKQENANTSPNMTKGMYMPQLINASVAAMENNYSSLKTHSSPRQYFIEYHDCFTE